MCTYIKFTLRKEESKGEKRRRGERRGKERERKEGREGGPTRLPEEEVGYR